MSLDNEMDQMVRGNELSSLRATVAHLTAELAAVGQQLEFDRTAVADCMTAANMAIDMRHWLTEGRGPYEWNDDNWHKEFYAAALEVKAALEPLTKIAANWKDCPQTTEEVAKARIDLTADLTAAREDLDKWERLASEVASALDRAYVFIDKWGTEECVTFMVGTKPPVHILRARDEAKLAQGRAEGLREAKAVALGCKDYGGGYHGTPQLAAFHHGMETVATAIQSRIDAPDSLQSRVVLSVGIDELDRMAEQAGKEQDNG